MTEEELEDSIGAYLGEPLKYHRRLVIIPWLIWAGIIGCVLWFAVSLSGCASAPSTPESKVCELQLIGQTRAGNAVVLQACLSPEDYAKAQKE